MSMTCKLCGAPRDAGARYCPACGNRFKEQVDRYDGFISYRREGGSHIAALLKLLLETGFGKRFFLDVDALQVGRFDETLLGLIGRSPNFILILSAGCLDRCPDKNDWLKREIMHALETQRNIVPVLVDGFLFPDEKTMELLPEAMRVLPNFQAVAYSHLHRESAVRKIAEYCVNFVPTDGAVPQTDAPQVQPCRSLPIETLGARPMNSDPKATLPIEGIEMQEALGYVSRTDGSSARFTELKYIQENHALLFTRSVSAPDTSWTKLRLSGIARIDLISVTDGEQRDISEQAKTTSLRRAKVSMRSGTVYEGYIHLGLTGWSNADETGQFTDPGIRCIVFAAKN